MRITIAQRYRPFSHTPGTQCLIPGTHVSAQFFPAFIRLFEAEEVFAEFELEIQGPVQDFTVELDLEKGWVRVFGKAANGFFRYRLQADPAEKKINLMVEKGEMLKGTVFPIATPMIQPLITERLSFGSHKKQDWDLVKRRQDLKEILPVWYALGQMIPPKEPETDQGTYSLLQALDDADKLGKSQAFLNLFNGGFHGILCPRILDETHLGFTLPPADVHFSAVPLIHEGMKRIRSMLIQEKDGEIAVLPQCPPEFHAGRMTSVQLAQMGQVDLEWSKKKVRRMKWVAKKSGTMPFSFSKEIRTFRLRKVGEDRGTYFSTQTPIEVAEGGIYEFDRFEK